METLRSYKSLIPNAIISCPSVGTDKDGKQCKAECEVTVNKILIEYFSLYNMI